LFVPREEQKGSEDVMNLIKTRSGY